MEAVPEPEGAIELEGVAEHVGTLAIEPWGHSAGQPQGVGAPEPCGQKEPAGHATCVAEQDPAWQ